MIVESITEQVFKTFGFIDLDHINTLILTLNFAPLLVFYMLA